MSELGKLLRDGEVWSPAVSLSGDKARQTRCQDSLKVLACERATVVCSNTAV